jgi:hypothetical protein
LRETASPQLVGSCIEDEHHDPQSGDALQRTTGGLLDWRKADNWTAFTDGARTWINGPSGLAYRLNDQLFSWEADAAAFPPTPNAGPRCGTERWPVKTLSDPQASAVNTASVPQTVDGLRALPAPTLSASTPRITGVETSTFRVEAVLVRIALEDDRDIHLVIADPTDTSHSMIVEFADPECQGPVESGQHAQMAAARAAFEAACGMAVRGRFRAL